MSLTEIAFAVESSATIVIASTDIHTIVVDLAITVIVLAVAILTSGDDVFAGSPESLATSAKSFFAGRMTLERRGTSADCGCTDVVVANETCTAIVVQTTFSLLR
jgi:hypothetical protein